MLRGKPPYFDCRKVSETMNLARRTARLLAEKQEERLTLTYEIDRIKATQALSRGTQYAIDFANPGESVISREELEYTITEDIGVLEAEEGEASRIIDEAIAAGELEDGGQGEEYRRVLIPFRTWRKAGYRV